MSDSHGNGHPSGSRPKSIDVKILRQDGPGQSSYYERHRIPYQSDMNVISVLQTIAAQAKTAEGKGVSPVAWDCNCLEEVCGACTMVINGKVRQSCSALVDKLLAEQPEEILLEPMTKFPVVRDLVVDRGRMFQALKKVQAWIDVDGYYDAGPGPRQSPADQDVAYPLSQCMSCGCCLDACPQYLKTEVVRQSGETEEAYEQRKKAAYNESFIGAAAISQAILINTHPTGKMNASARLDALTDTGGIQDCGNAQNCVQVCPKTIPLPTSIAKAGRATTFHVIRKWFDK